MARLFDDAASEFLANNAGTPVTAGPFAMAVWGSLDADLSIAMALAVGDQNDTSWHGLFLRGSTSDYVGMQSESGTSYQRAQAAIAGGMQVNAWYHLAGIVESDTVHRAYVNGVKGTGSGGSGTPSTSGIDRVGIGRTMDSDQQWYWSGALAEAAIWNLTAWPGATAAAKADEFERLAVPALAKGYSPLFFPLGLVACWPLGGIKSDDNAANAASGDRDIVGGYHMSPYNTPSVADHPPIIYPSGPFWPGFVAGGAGTPSTIELPAFSLVI
jgi:hypothetical protein